MKFTAHQDNGAVGQRPTAARLLYETLLAQVPSFMQVVDFETPGIFAGQQVDVMTLDYEWDLQHFLIVVHPTHIQLIAMNSFKDSMIKVKGVDGTPPPAQLRECFDGAAASFFEHYLAEHGKPHNCDLKQARDNFTAKMLAYTICEELTGENQLINFEITFRHWALYADIKIETFWSDEAPAYEYQKLSLSSLEVQADGLPVQLFGHHDMVAFEANMQEAAESYLISE